MRAGIRARQQKVGYDFGIGVAHLRLALGDLVGDLAQGTADAVRQARELHRVGVRKKLALARYRSLERTPGHPADETRRHQRQAHQHGKTAPAAGIRGLGQPAPKIEDHLQAEDITDQPHVEPRIAVEDVAELMRHHALEFIPGEPLQRTARHRHHTVLLLPAGGKGIDGFLALQYKNAR